MNRYPIHLLFRLKAIVKLFCLITIIPAALPLGAQEFNPPLNWQANRFGQEHGLLQLNVKGMALDSMGFLWVGTEDGLHRFNGYGFKAFVHNPNDSTSLKDDHIRGLLFRYNTLWMATTAQGIGAYIPAENRFFDPVDDTGSNDLKTTFRVLRHSDNKLIFSVLNHLICYDIDTGENTIFNLPVNNKTSYVTDVIHLPENKCWLSTTASGLLEMDTRKMDLRQLDFLKEKFINGLYPYQNKIYIGTETGMFVYDRNTGSIAETGLQNPTNCFYEKSPGEVFIGTDNGMFLFDPGKNEITPIILHTGENRIYESVDINQILGDPKGNLWIGTEGDGLLYYNSYQKKFNTVKVQLSEYPLTADISTFQILKETGNTILLGTKLGVVRYSAQTNSFSLFPSTKDILIYTLKQDSAGTIWAGGFTSGLLKFDEQNDRFQKITPKGKNFADEDIIEILPIDSRTLWIATWSGGMYRFDTQTSELSELRPGGKKINRARTSFIDSEGNIWLGTDEGAYRISNQNEVVRFHSGSRVKLSSDRVFSINQDRSGNIWIGTNVGLTMLNTENNLSRLYYQQKGLPNDFIYSILIDDTDNIWVSTNYGLSVLDQKSGNFKNYTESDGLQHNEFNGKAGYRDRDGLIYFAGISGLNIFHPETVTENPFLPKIHIESIELFNSELGQNELYKKKMKFKSRENVLTFNYAALNFLNPEKCDYSYKMEGFDEDWRPVTKQRSTTYTNLDPGEYTFMVKATNDAGIWNEDFAELKITIVPPWYETNYFRIGFVLVFVLSGVGYYFYQTRKLKHDKLKLETMVLHRTRQVRDKNKKLQEAFVAAEKQRDNISFLMKELRHRVKNNLQIISSLLNIQSNMMDNDSAVQALKMAKNRIIAISHIENKISSDIENIDVGAFIREISEEITRVLSGEENLKFRLKLNLCSIRLKKINTTLIGLILNELITNATKYAFDENRPENFLQIGCTTNNQKLIVTITDNGKGYNPNKLRSNSLGLELVHDMVHQLGGTLKIENDNGTKNTIEIPI